jgi:DNA polymerase-3 subunit gamma/tau
MAYEVLARKWRPQVFEDVIGQEHITQTLINAIKTERLAHAYLFSGPRGVGKTSVARILAKAINCEKGEPGNPCNQCQSCLEITAGSSVDVQEIDGASNRGIDEIRELREYIKYMPSSSRYRIYIIDEVHMLTLPAFNALLKTLEEPPAHVKFIFATTEYHKVPVTILSRCQRFDFKRIPAAQITEYLERITRKEGIHIPRSALFLIAREGEGSMRDAESLLDQVVSFTGSQAQEKDVIDILGIMDRGIIFEASRSIIEGSSNACLEIVDRIYNAGYDLKEFYRALMHQFRNLLLSLIAPDTLLLDLTENDAREARLQGEAAGSEKLQAILNFLITREEALRFTSHPRLVLETSLIKLCRLGDVLSFEALIQKIEALEKRLLENAAVSEAGRGVALSDPGVGWAGDTQKEKEEEGETESGAGKGWDHFLAFLSTRNKPMFNILKNWQFVRRAENVLEIAKDDQIFSANYLDDTQKIDQLTLYCREFFKEDLKIRILGDRQNTRKEKQGGAGEKVSSEAPTRTDLSRPIQDVLNVFQGEVRTVPHRARPDENHGKKSTK